MKKITQIKLAKILNISPPFVSQILSGKRGASPLIADHLSLLTKTDIRVWLNGGSAEYRREAISKIPNEYLGVN